MNALVIVNKKRAEEGRMGLKPVVRCKAWLSHNILSKRSVPSLENHVTPTVLDINEHGKYFYLTNLKEESLPGRPGFSPRGCRTRPEGCNLYLT